MNRSTFHHLWRECDGIVDRGVTDTFHMRQTATAMEAAGLPDPLVFAGLVHDLLKPVAMVRHAELAAIAFEGIDLQAVAFLAAHSEWVAAVRDGKGGGLRYRHRLLGEIDAAAFDPAAPCLPLAHFVPLLDRYLANS